METERASSSTASVPLKRNASSINDDDDVATSAKRVRSDELPPDDLHSCVMRASPFSYPPAAGAPMTRTVEFALKREPSLAQATTNAARSENVHVATAGPTAAGGPEPEFRAALLAKLAEESSNSSASAPSTASTQTGPLPPVDAEGDETDDPYEERSDGGWDDEDEWEPPAKISATAPEPPPANGSGQSLISPPPTPVPMRMDAASPMPPAQVVPAGADPTPDSAAADTPAEPRFLVPHPPVPRVSSSSEPTPNADDADVDDDWLEAVAPSNFSLPDDSFWAPRSPSPLTQPTHSVPSPPLLVSFPVLPAAPDEDEYADSGDEEQNAEPVAPGFAARGSAGGKVQCALCGKWMAPRRTADHVARLCGTIPDPKRGPPSARKPKRRPPPSRPKSASSTPRKPRKDREKEKEKEAKLSAAQVAELAADRWAAQWDAARGVRCAACEAWVDVGGALQRWSGRTGHKSVCGEIVETVKREEAEAKLRALTHAHEAPAPVPLAILADKRVRRIDGDQAQCNECGIWTLFKNWDAHQGERCALIKARRDAKQARRAAAAGSGTGGAAAGAKVPDAMSDLSSDSEFEGENGAVSVRRTGGDSTKRPSGNGSGSTSAVSSKGAPPAAAAALAGSFASAASVSAATSSTALSASATVAPTPTTVPVSANGAPAAAKPSSSLSSGAGATAPSSSSSRYAMHMKIFRDPSYGMGVIPADYVPPPRPSPPLPTKRPPPPPPVPPTMPMKIFRDPRYGMGVIPAGYVYDPNRIGKGQGKDKGKTKAPSPSTSTSSANPPAPMSLALNGTKTAPGNAKRAAGTSAETPVAKKAKVAAASESPAPRKKMPSLESIVAEADARAAAAAVEGSATADASKPAAVASGSTSLPQSGAAGDAVAAQSVPPTTSKPMGRPRLNLASPRPRVMELGRRGAPAARPSTSSSKPEVEAKRPEYSTVDMPEPLKRGGPPVMQLHTRRRLCGLSVSMSTDGRDVRFMDELPTDPAELLRYERQVILQYDADVAQVGADNTVQCQGCKSWIKLPKTYVGKKRWYGRAAHKACCQGNIERRQAAASEEAEDAAEVRFAKPFRIRGIKGDKVQCAGCGKKISCPMWARHLDGRCTFYTIPPSTPKAESSDSDSEAFESWMSAQATTNGKPQVPLDVTIAKRRAQLLEDAAVREIGEDKVLCDPCGRWVKISKHMYAEHKWYGDQGHRKRCVAAHPNWKPRLDKIEQSPSPATSVIASPAKPGSSSSAAVSNPLIVSLRSPARATQAPPSLSSAIAIPDTSSDHEDHDDDDEYNPEDDHSDIESESSVDPELDI
ncbi:hypothetical protein AURDEDRAFT_113484 [Auricularia subglabra TFB-10046 SS5]|nr:hypothetical protein AURDEDRAFT_113484 [Auricularia subglabra TFB-10046 SS5]